MKTIGWKAICCEQSQLFKVFEPHPLSIWRASMKAIAVGLVEQSLITGNCEQLNYGKTEN